MQSGFVSSQTALTKESGNPGERVVHLLGQETRMDSGPQGLGSVTPATG